MPAGSVAEPDTVMLTVLCPGAVLKTAPFDGELIVMTGPVLSIVKVTVATLEKFPDVSTALAFTV